MWISVILAVFSLIFLLVPSARRNEKILFGICFAIFASIWIDKGLAMVVAGFIPTSLSEVVNYWPTIPEVMISLGVWAIGFFLITVFYKIALSVRGELIT